MEYFKRFNKNENKMLFYYLLHILLFVTSGVLHSKDKIVK